MLGNFQIFKANKEQLDMLNPNTQVQSKRIGHDFKFSECPNSYTLKVITLNMKQKVWLSSND